MIDRSRECLTLRQVVARALDTDTLSAQARRDELLQTQPEAFRTFTMAQIDRGGEADRMAAPCAPGAVTRR
ncbi:hypothetical protein [Azospirillum thermophilum]|uniref:Uncharacterized protein n=1 Tax=Azospirillum thermophilum TaxID=2202148 RepID=A0A2S2CSU7_9PROT|nr:hypothetical protein [Azospirillum thermophilum]AWK87495.1 hypothetical protein DEW08_15845 [Azospirillum thermophilum]